MFIYLWLHVALCLATYSCRRISCYTIFIRYHSFIGICIVIGLIPIVFYSYLWLYVLYVAYGVIPRKCYWHCKHQRPVARCVVSFDSLGKYRMQCLGMGWGSITMEVPQNGQNGWFIGENHGKSWKIMENPKIYKLAWFLGMILMRCHGMDGLLMIWGWFGVMGQAENGRIPSERNLSYFEICSIVVIFLGWRPKNREIFMSVNILKNFKMPQDWRNNTIKQVIHHSVQGLSRWLDSFSGWTLAEGDGKRDWRDW